MARNLDDVIGSLPAERQAAIASRHAELREEAGLAAIRKAVGMGQSDVAEALGIRQPSVSKIERQSDMNLSTLRDYVAAVGGELELVVRLPSGKAVTLQVSDASDTGGGDEPLASGRASRTRAAVSRAGRMGLAKRRAGKRRVGRGMREPART